VRERERKLTRKLFFKMMNSKEDRKYELEQKKAKLDEFRRRKLERLNNNNNNNNVGIFESLLLLWGFRINFFLSILKGG
jgi:hypothetical protein